MKKLLAGLMAALMALSLASCGGEGGSSAESSAASSVAESSEAESSAEDSSAEESSAATAELPTEDPSGNPITIPDEVETIISMAPSVTQTLIDLGLEDKLIAVDTNSAEYYDLGDLPAFNMMTPDTEQMIALAPDLVFTSGMSSAGGSDPFEPLRDMGACVADIPSASSIEVLKDDVLFVAQCVGMTEEGQALIAEAEAEIDAIAAIGETITDRKTVLFEIASAPNIYSFGSGTFLDEMITIIGADNVLADQEGYVALTEEAAISANPDVILTNVNYIDDPVGEILGRTGWENVTAVAEGAVYSIDTNASSQPNLHIIDALKQMAKAVYPEEYAEVEDPFAALMIFNPIAAVNP